MRQENGRKMRTCVIPSTIISYVLLVIDHNSKVPMKTYQVRRSLLGGRSGGGRGLALGSFGRHFDECVGLQSKNSGEFCDDEDGLGTGIWMMRDAIEQLSSAL